MMKRIISLMICLTIFITVCGCSKEGKVITQIGTDARPTGASDTKIDDRKEDDDGKKSAAPVYADTYSEKQLFKVKSLDTYPTKWNDEDGLYIFSEVEGSIPYLLIFRCIDMPIDVSQYMEESIVPFINEDYADQNLKMEPVTREKVGGKELLSVKYSYDVGEYRVTAQRLFLQHNKDIVNFTVKYYDDDQIEPLDEMLERAVSSFTTLTKAEMYAAKAKPEDGANYKIIPSEAAMVEYTSYTDFNNYITMDIPVGWEVIIGIKPTREFDILSYGIELRDPAVPERMLYFNLSTSGLVKSQAAHDWYVKYYGADYPLSKTPVLSDLTTKGFFESVASWYGYSDLNVLENMDKIVVFEANSERGKKVECVATTYVTAINYNVNSNMYSIFSPQIDAGWATAYDIVMEAAPVEEFYDWQPVLDHCLGSIKFSEKYLNDRNETWKRVIGTAATTMSTADEISDMIMDSWEKSSHTYDVTNQKYSDAILGYERIYDNETGDYYRVELGFSDWYEGERYVADDSDAAYTSPVKGTIYKVE
jgi:hypothetical protein